MTKFKGTINGVNYTDETEFMKALMSKAGEKNMRVQYSIYDDETKEDEQKLQKASAERPAIQTHDGEYTELFEQLFVPFMRAMAGFTKNENNKNSYDKKNVEAQKPANANLVTLDKLVKEFIFPWTTYVFTGDTKDEVELDKFSSLLKTKIDTFAELDLSSLTQEQKISFGKQLDSKISSAKNFAIKCENEMKTVDANLSKFENLERAYQDFGAELPTDIAEKFEHTKREFDARHNKRNYFSLLIDYYKEISSHIDYTEI